MNKICNNLTIENLIKTDWKNQFDKKQRRIIEEGLEKNLDVSIYAKIDFTWMQMKEISWGLEDNLDVSIYANPTFTLDKMEKIRRKLLKESTLS